MKPSLAKQLLLAHPLEFLSNHYVSCTRKTGCAGPAMFWLGCIEPLEPNKANVVITPTRQEVGDDSVAVGAWHVEIVHSDGGGVAFLPGMAISRHSGPELMVTTVLNGCTFCVAQGENDIFVAHVRARNTSSYNLHSSIIDEGRILGVDAPVMSFGPASGYGILLHQITVIGRRFGTRWQIFVQRQVRNPRSLDGAELFLEV